MTQNKNLSLVEELIPSTSIVDIEVQLNGIENYISEHAILPNGASAAIALWCVATYSINNFTIFPRLAIISPEKRCGKSTVLDLVEAFCMKSLFTSNISAAAIFRLIDHCQPTLIIDEADTFIAGRGGDMTGIINSGHAKSRAFVTRCEGEHFQPKRFSTWTPMALASIGNLPPTIMDRSVVISLRRKTISESVLRIPLNLHGNAKSVRRKLLKWTNEIKQSIKENLTEPPRLENDRAVDNWLPLFTIANLAGPEWLRKCEDAYHLLNDHEEEPLMSTLLLSDIRDIFTTHNPDKISSAELVEKLVAFEDKPWCEIRRGGYMSQNNLATMLKIYGIKPKGIRYNGNTPRGYELGQFTDAFARYLPSP